MSRAEKFSFAFVVVLLASVAALHLAAPFLAVIFSYFVLQKLSLTRYKVIPVLLFALVVTGIGFGLYYFSHQALVAIPNIAQTALPVAKKFAEDVGLTLPFTDLDSLTVMVRDGIMEEHKYWAGSATRFTRHVVFAFFGVIIAVSLFLNSKFELERERNIVKDNLYSLTCDAVARRFSVFYDSFATVMGAQLLISFINTALTSIFIMWFDFPDHGLIIAVTFLCGLLPIIGNIISNIVIVGIGFTVEPRMGVLALIYLIVLHKLEYFLNSKIIGQRIRNPMWLTLVGLIIGERLMGIPGMILAPVVLHYIKAETSRIPVGEVPLVRDMTARQAHEFVDTASTPDR